MKKSLPVIFLEAYGVLFDDNRSDNIIELESPFKNKNTTAVRYVDERGGHIDVWENSPWAPRDNSVIEFEVNESSRGIGIGTNLAKYVLNKYSSLSAQVSSMASLKIFYNLGLRPPSAINASFDELVELFNENGGSLGMMTN